MRDEQAFGAVDLRAVLGAFATGVTVATTLNSAGERRAITISAFSSVSLDPPLVLICVDKAAFHFDSFAGAEAFAVNILAAEQGALSDRFAREVDDGFEDLGAEALVTGCPVFPDALAALDCALEATHEAGDHVILVGRVAALKAPRTADPLLYFRGGYAGLRR